MSFCYIFLKLLHLSLELKRFFWKMPIFMKHLTVFYKGIIYSCNSLRMVNIYLCLLLGNLHTNRCIQWHPFNCLSSHLSNNEVPLYIIFCWEENLNQNLHQKHVMWLWQCINEPPHDKTNNVAVRPAKTQISLGIRPVWSESSLSAWRKLGSLPPYWAHIEDSD